MSEKLSVQHEGHQSPEEHKDHQERLKNHLEKHAEKAKHEHAEDIDNIRSKVEKEAKAKHEHAGDKKPDRSHEEQPLLVSKSLKNEAYRRTLKKTQAQLSAPARTFSKIIHQPIIENASEFASKTIARPSGILLGGIFSFLGSSAFLWIAHRYGYEYNFLLFIAFFVGGFFVGLLVELGLSAANRRQ